MRKSNPLKRLLRRILTLADWATDPLPLQMATGAEAIARRRKKSQRPVEEDSDDAL